MDTQFRGRVQMVLSSIFPISDKSGVNQKGLYNLNNLTQSGNFKEEHHKKVFNFRFYKQFWMIHKYLANPFLVTKYILINISYLPQEIKLNLKIRISLNY
jgi:hypothetical protein